MSTLARAINAAWMVHCRPEYRKFQVATNNVARTQSRLLLRTLVANSHTTYGREYEFDLISNYRDFATRVPVASWDTVQPFVDRICDGEANVLTSDPVLLLEPTSGTTSGRKLIPFTHTLQKQMRRAVSAWIANLYQYRPAVRRGPAYWSISPAIGADEKTSGGIRIGFEDDTAYLGGLAQIAARRILVVPPLVTRLTDISEFRRQTLVRLLLARDLSLISIWSPTFLTVLIEELFQTSDQLLDELSKISRGRSRQVATILNSGLSRSGKLENIWPCLALVSCWADGGAGGYLGQLTKLFPAVEIQPKGLLATEAIVSFPLMGRGGGALAIRSHFFEFASANDGTSISLAHDLRVGERYIPIVTTGGGLYRYKMNDVIEVVGKEGDCPLIRFVERLNGSSDLVGEKLDEAFVRESIGHLTCLRNGTATMMLVPGGDNPPHYKLFIQPAESSTEDFDTSAISSGINTLLDRNPHYRYARELGQLGRTQTVIVRGDSNLLWRLYERACIEDGMKIGDIKPTMLVSNREVAARFQRLAEDITIRHSKH